MKFTMPSILAVAFATTVSSADIEKRDTTLPAQFTLQSTTTGLDGILWNSLMYANSSAYIGNIKYSIYSEPLILSGVSGGAGSAEFISIHGVPTGFQNIYIFPEESQPIGFTIPHSAGIPPNASINGFSDCDNLLRYDRGNGLEDLWKACPVATELASTGSWQIYWDGAANLTDCVVIDLTIINSTCST